MASRLHRMGLATRPIEDQECVAAGFDHGLARRAMAVALQLPPAVPFVARQLRVEKSSIDCPPLVPRYNNAWS